MNAPIREGDVFRFSYTEAERAKRFMPDHCFDGQLVAIKRGEGLILADTFWLYNFQELAGEARTFTEEHAREVGELTLKCNLDEIEKIREGDLPYYDGADVLNLTYHHGHHGYFAIRKGTQKSPAKMLRVIEQQAEDARREIRHAQFKIERLAEYAKKVEAGELSEVYL